MYNRVLITGSRTWKNPKHLIEVLDKRNWIHSILIQGGANGADKMAKIYAKRNGIAEATIDANWDFYGSKAAGPVRNGWMLYLEPTSVIAFYGEKSIGTKDMVRKARMVGIEDIEEHWEDEICCE